MTPLDIRNSGSRRRSRPQAGVIRYDPHHCRRLDVHLRPVLAVWSAWPRRGLRIRKLPAVRSTGTAFDASPIACRPCGTGGGVGVTDLNPGFPSRATGRASLRDGGAGRCRSRRIDACETLVSFTPVTGGFGHAGGSCRTSRQGSRHGSASRIITRGSISMRSVVIRFAPPPPSPRSPPSPAPPPTR
jgi:hypothetical protein